MTWLQYHADEVDRLYKWWMSKPKEELVNQYIDWLNLPNQYRARLHTITKHAITLHLLSLEFGKQKIDWVVKNKLACQPVSK